MAMSGYISPIIRSSSLSKVLTSSCDKVFSSNWRVMLGSIKVSSANLMVQQRRPLQTVSAMQIKSFDVPTTSVMLRLDFVFDHSKKRQLVKPAATVQARCLAAALHRAQSSSIMQQRSWPIKIKRYSFSKYSAFLILSIKLMHFANIFTVHSGFIIKKDVYSSKLPKWSREGDWLVNVSSSIIIWPGIGIVSKWLEMVWNTLC